MENRKWRRAQREYVGWANTRLPQHYVNNIIGLGRKFRKFIGRQGKCLDVGCGNGLIGGRSYKNLGYSYLAKGSVVGVDPLTLQGPKQTWLSEFVRGVCEFLNFKDSTFDSIVFATTLDHVENVPACLQECKRVLKHKGTLNVWLTCVLKARGRYVAHPNRFTQPMLENVLVENGFTVVDTFVSPFMGISIGGRAVSSGNTVFIKACKNHKEVKKHEKIKTNLELAN